jgi:hypothetical protein
MWALIIGVNEYSGTKLHRLFGAINDASRVDTYLRTHLHVPVERIFKLLGAQATRSNIIKHFRVLELSPEIQRGDAIVIYYAGHGGESSVPAQWHTSGMRIQVIFPVDVNTKDKAGNMVYPIPDRTIAVLLNDIAKAKGNNIVRAGIILFVPFNLIALQTMIMDCCHSASSTRTDPFEGRIPRNGAISVDLPSDLDRHILTEVDPDLVLSFKFAHHALKSHTLLAACGVNQFAFEYRGYGSFTKQLIDTLVTHGTKTLTYIDLMRRLPPLPRQVVIRFNICVLLILRIHIAKTPSVKGYTLIAYFSTER